MGLPPLQLEAPLSPQPEFSNIECIVPQKVTSTRKSMKTLHEEDYSQEEVTKSEKGFIQGLADIIQTVPEGVILNPAQQPDDSYIENPEPIQINFEVPEHAMREYELNRSSSLGGYPMDDDD